VLPAVPVAMMVVVMMMTPVAMVAPMTVVAPVHLGGNVLGVILNRDSGAGTGQR